MTRLIDADALKEVMYNEAVNEAEVGTHFSPYQVAFEYFDIEEYIDNAPTIEPIEDIKSCGVIKEEQNTLPSAEPSDDLISREEAIDAVTTWGTNEERNGNLNMFMVSVKQRVVDILSALPSADRPTEYNLETIADIVRQLGHLDSYIADTCDRPKGKWINREDSADVFFLYKYECSVCGGKSVFDSTYCPNCGAEMNGE